MELESMLQDVLHRHVDHERVAQTDLDGADKTRKVAEDLERVAKDMRLHRAILDNDPEAVCAAIEAGADPNGCVSRYVPVQLAAKFGYADVIRALLRGGAVITRFYGEDTKHPIEYAIRHDHADAMQVIFDAVSDERHSTLLRAKVYERSTYHESERCFERYLELGWYEGVVSRSNLMGIAVVNGTPGQRAFLCRRLAYSPDELETTLSSIRPLHRNGTEAQLRDMIEARRAEQPTV